MINIYKLVNIVLIGDTMFIFLTILIVAISLSMDTFSLSLSYGMLNIKKKEILKISFFVGVFHFFMPLFGNIIGKVLFNYIPVDENKIIGIIFLTISVDIIFSLFKNKEISSINSINEILFFSFTVSIDSFITGTCLDVFNTNYFFITFLFMIVSFLFTYIGLSIGYYIHDRIGVISEIIGIILLISLSFFYLIY